MANLEWGKARKTMIEEQAMAALESLQLLHPHRFEYLKLELKSFIHLLQSQSDEFLHHPNAVEASNRSPAPPALESQESSSCRKKRKEGLRRDVAESETGERIRRRRRRDRVEVVLERAAVCLRKIRRFKTALFSAAD